MSFTSWLQDCHSFATREHARRSKVKQRGFRPRLEALEGRVVLSTLTVTNTLDSGPGSLRAEIAAAKSNSTILFDLGPGGHTITLTSGELDITKNLTIQGPGAGLLTVSGGGTSRVFEVAKKKMVTLSDLAISDGFSLAGATEFGGGVYNHGTLTVNGCALSGNRAMAGGGIANDFGGTLTVSGCTLSDNFGGEGGGIWNGGTLTVSASTVGSSVDPTTGSALSGNAAEEGAGIYNEGKASVSSSTLSGNSATAGDLGLGYGGGIYNDFGGTLTVNGCTLSGNSAGDAGGGIYNAGTLTVSNSVFSGNIPGNIVGPYKDGGGNSFS